MRLHASTGEATIDVDVSYTPNDFLEELIVAVAAVMSCVGTFGVTLHEEPGSVTLRLTRRQAMVTFLLTRKTDDDPLLVFSGPLESLQHTTQGHQFEFTIDQTWLPPLIAQCENVLKRYPVLSPEGRGL